MPTCVVTGNKHDWCWNEDQKRAFEKIKFKILIVPVLSSFDIRK